MAKRSRGQFSFNAEKSLNRVLGFSRGVNDIVGAIKNLAAMLTAVGSTFFAIVGTSVSTGAIRMPSIPLDEAAFPIRFVLLIVVAAGLGWALGALAALTDFLPRELRAIVANLLAVLFAGLIAGTADWLVGEGNARAAVPQGLIMTLIGAGVAMRSLAYQFEVMHPRRDRSAIRSRTTLMLILSGATAIIILLGELGVK